MGRKTTHSLTHSLCCRTGTISPGDYLLAVGDVWLDNHSLEEAARVLTVADKVVKLRIQKNVCYAGNIIAGHTGNIITWHFSLVLYSSQIRLVLTALCNRR